MEKTANRHRKLIGLFGARNSGKSSLMNALLRQEAAIVSPVAGTTTDVVRKAMELRGVGPVSFLDTPGYDEPEDDLLGRLRVGKMREAVRRTDLALLLIPSLWTKEREEWERQLPLLKEQIFLLKEYEVPLIFVLHDFGTGADEALAADRLGELLREGEGLIAANAKQAEGVLRLEEALRSYFQKESGEKRLLTGGLVRPSDLVMLVMPQDRQAPKGRLIPAQTETIRELLDLGAMTLVVTPEKMTAALAALRNAPDLIICDSQVFRETYEKKGGSPLTSFSVLYSAYKGDLAYYLQGVRVLEHLSPEARILISEACSHQPTNEDIGRVKLPRMLRKKWGERIHIDVVAAKDFPQDLGNYDLMIQCGGCMFTRKEMMGRLLEAKRQGLPATNYGLAIASLQGILPYVTLPKSEGH